MWRKQQTALLFLALLTFWLAAVSPVQAVPLSSPTERIFGETQIDTAIAVSQAGWDRADTVLIANAYQFPDALVAAPLSHQLDAPILLNSTDRLEPAVLAEIRRLGARHVILLGGEAVLKPQIPTELAASGLTVERIWGQDAYETAAKVAERVGEKGDVIIVSGEQFADALAVSAYAGVTETPILLTMAKTMPAPTKEILQRFQAEAMTREGGATAIVVGGEAVVSSTILDGVKGIVRIAGEDRYETASKVYYFAQDILDAPVGYLVTGEQFPDALVAGTLAARDRAGLFMAEKASLPAVTYSALGTAADKKDFKTVLVGGPAVLTQQVIGMVDGTVVPKYLLAGVTIVVDPGHGGKDTGAIGATGSYEKNNTLPTALWLADMLRTAGARVILTRTDDAPPTGSNYVELADLQARVEIANKAKANLYISIHNDAATNETAGGTTSYYSSGNPVKDKSIDLGKQIQAEVVKELGLQNRGVKDSQFYVVKYTEMPAVLVELGFLSNPREEEMLGSVEYQKRAARGIYKGILIYKGW